MLATDRIKELFADAHEVQAQAVDLLSRGDVRDAAEKAWCATKRATEALVLSRTGREPQTPAQTTAGLRTLAYHDKRFEPLRSYFNTCVKELHVDCFYDGHCEPVEEIAATIQHSAQYLADAERLASGPR